MPRLARLDITGLLQHVIVRGIEGRDIFNDDNDRQLFVNRLFSLLSETGVHCHAWALLSNHFHLLLMPTSTSLSYFMRRLLTGYAVSFNRRNKRSEGGYRGRCLCAALVDPLVILQLSAQTFRTSVPEPVQVYCLRRAHLSTGIGSLYSP
jgi:REP element-mobilizing transposase RayT